MPMDSHDNQSTRWWHSFVWAFRGIQQALRQEAHMRVHAVVTVIVVVAGIYYRLPMAQWLLLIGWISGVIALELVNTAIEACVDLAVGTRYHELAKYSKDVAAGAVLIVAIGAFVSGMMIFIPYFLQ